MPSSLKMTVPVGVPAAGAAAATVTVKVTDWPKTDGCADEPRLTVEFAMFTTWLNGLAVLSLAVKFVSPL